jgi:hypothetical protein
MLDALLEIMATTVQYDWVFSITFAYSYILVNDINVSK